MTNAQIILNESISLMNQGVLKGTGRFLRMTFLNEEGEEVTQEVEEPEAIHTYAVWKQLGYQVKRGEKAKATITIWKYTEKPGTMEAKNDKGETVEIDAPITNMFMKKSFFFTIDQVEKATKTA